LLRRRFDGDRRIAARQRQQLILLEREVVGFFKRRQRVRPFNKFRRGGQLKVAALFQIAGKVA
jgi:hypothetical protein